MSVLIWPSSATTPTASYRYLQQPAEQAWIQPSGLSLIEIANMQKKQSTDAQHHSKAFTPEKEMQKRQAFFNTTKRRKNGWNLNAKA